MNFPKHLFSLTVFAAALLLLVSCASNPEARLALRQIRSASLNNNVEFHGGIEAPEDRQISGQQQALVDEFVREVNGARIFAEPLVVVRASLETWREEVGEMRYDGQFKLKLRHGTKEGFWEVQAILQSRAGSVVWRAAKTVKGGAGGLDSSALRLACNALVKNLQRSRR